MHKKSMDVCVLIIDKTGDSEFEVQWFNVGYVGTPWPLDNLTQKIYMHPDVWTDITENLTIPRDKWN